MYVNKIEIRTHRREELVDITSKVRMLIRNQNQNDGKITLFVPHTTAAVTINENADPTVPGDIIFSLNKISPIYREFRHLEGNSDAHIKSSLIGNTQDIFFQDKELILGTWQGIFFCEFDGSRHRHVITIIQNV
ncbi:MAG: secondary thiamine-phosphate synthase enzyme YjbQ [Candidatus Cloacimonetes bacterium]|nr:secondary thiamine-phosphate synthase enzyme YjbQ [Candidatus Cloacimonadota bacterium]